VGGPSAAPRPSARPTDTASADVNNAPVLSAAAPSMGTTNEDTAKTISLATFINGSTGTSTITDPDGNAVRGGIALVGLTSHGAWAYSLNGTDFTDVGTVSQSSALLLPKDAYVAIYPGQPKRGNAHHHLPGLGYDQRHGRGTG